MTRGEGPMITPPRPPHGEVVWCQAGLPAGLSKPPPSQEKTQWQNGGWFLGKNFPFFLNGAFCLQGFTAAGPLPVYTGFPILSFPLTAW